MEAFRFEEPLIEGLIKNRPNRFIMNIEVDGTSFKAHCPTTGKVGNVIFDNIPCLLSKSSNPKRQTPYTVEAFSLDPIDKPDKKWVGINQVKANRYVEHFIRTGALGKMFSEISNLRREVKLDDSRIDFLVNDSFFIEVKTLLNTFYTDKFPVLSGPKSKFNSYDRLIKHFKAITKVLKSGKDFSLLLCYMYDAKPFVRPKRDETNGKILKAALEADAAGMGQWQINLELSPKEARLIRCFPLEDL
jgi:sugar fermentation stimulation protein A